MNIRKYHENLQSDNCNRRSNVFIDVTDSLIGGWRNVSDVGKFNIHDRENRKRNVFCQQCHYFKFDRFVISGLLHCVVGSDSLKSDDRSPSVYFCTNDTPRSLFPVSDAIIHLLLLNHHRQIYILSLYR